MEETTNLALSQQKKKVTHCVTVIVYEYIKKKHQKKKPQHKTTNKGLYKPDVSECCEYKKRRKN